MGNNAPRYDLFKDLPDGPLWVGCETDLKAAKKKISDLSAADGLDYFVYDVVSEAVAARAGPGQKT